MFVVGSFVGESEHLVTNKKNISCQTTIHRRSPMMWAFSRNSFWSSLANKPNRKKKAALGCAKLVKSAVPHQFAHS